MNHFRLLLLPLSAILLLSGCQTTEHAAASAAISDLAKTPTPKELDDLNALFLGSYGARLKEVKQSVEPLIVADFDTLTFTWKGASETNEVIPAIYHSLKVVAHVPIGLFLVLQPVAQSGRGEIKPAVATTLKDYRDQITVAASALARAGFTPAQLTRQQHILDRSAALCDQTRRTGKIGAHELLQFTRALGPALLANTAEAAVAQLHATHATVMRWRDRVPAERWRELTVVVRGPQTPRRLNLFTQYFARVLDDRGHNLGYPLEGRRLVYAEYLLPGRDHLDLLATTLLDGDASEAFFGERWRLSRDLLADEVQRQLGRLNF